MLLKPHKFNGGHASSGRRPVDLVHDHSKHLIVNDDLLGNHLVWRKKNENTCRGQHEVYAQGEKAPPGGWTHVLAPKNLQLVKAESGRDAKTVGAGHIP